MTKLIVKLLIFLAIFAQNEAVNCISDSPIASSDSDLCNEVSYKCEFHTSTFKDTAPTYDCFIEFLPYSHDYKISNFYGQHADGKTNNNVTGFVAGGKELKLIPKNLNQFFPNLESITFQHTSISSISQDDFKELKNLKVLEIFDSDIESISGEIFKLNEKLEWIDLHSNKLRSIDAQVFQGLANLKSLFLDRNICVDKFAAKNRERVLELIEKVKEDC